MFTSNVLGLDIVLHDLAPYLSFIDKLASLIRTLYYLQTSDLLLHVHCAIWFLWIGYVNNMSTYLTILVKFPIWYPWVFMLTFHLEANFPGLVWNTSTTTSIYHRSFRAIKRYKYWLLSIRVQDFRNHWCFVDLKDNRASSNASVILRFISYIIF